MTFCVFFSPAQFSVSRKVWKVACGWLHTILITEDRKALSCGTNEHGQLGRTSLELEIGKNVKKCLRSLCPDSAFVYFLL